MNFRSIVNNDSAHPRDKWWDEALTGYTKRFGQAICMTP